MPLDFQRVEIPRDQDALIGFLCNEDWALHSRRLLNEADVRNIDFTGPDVAAFWIVDDGAKIGLVRLFDLGDIGEGAPLFDLRIASQRQGSGVGTTAAQWLVDYLFTTYSQLHRIEANTRHDNVAMQRVLQKAGFAHEGRLRAAWHSDQGQWFDTMIYGMLRVDWHG